MRMAGGALEGMNLDAFITQATEYEDEEDLFARWSRAWVEIALTHPFAVRRVRELIAWVETGEFDRIRDGSYVRRGSEPPTVEGVRGSGRALPRALRPHARAHDGRRAATRQPAGGVAARPGPAATGDDEPGLSPVASGRR